MRAVTPRIPRGLFIDTSEHIRFLLFSFSVFHFLVFGSMRQIKLTKSSSRWGFATADDSKRLQAVIRRGIHSGLCEQHHKTVEELVEEAGDKLFTDVIYNKQYVVRPTLPCTMDTKYHLRPRPHNFKLAIKNRSAIECDFITRMLFKDVY